MLSSYDFRDRNFKKNNESLLKFAHATSPVYCNELLSTIVN